MPTDPGNHPGAIVGQPRSIHGIREPLTLSRVRRVAGTVTGTGAGWTQHRGRPGFPAGIKNAATSPTFRQNRARCPQVARAGLHLLVCLPRRHFARNRFRWHGKGIAVASRRHFWRRGLFGSGTRGGSVHSGRERSQRAGLSTIFHQVQVSACSYRITHPFSRRKRGNVGPHFETGTTTFSFHNNEIAGDSF